MDHSRNKKKQSLSTDIVDGGQQDIGISYNALESRLLLAAISDGDIDPDPIFSAQPSAAIQGNQSSWRLLIDSTAVQPPNALAYNEWNQIGTESTITFVAMSGSSPSGNVENWRILSIENSSDGTNFAPATGGFANVFTITGDVLRQNNPLDYNSTKAIRLNMTLEISETVSGVDSTNTYTFALRLNIVENVNAPVPSPSTISVTPDDTHTFSTSDFPFTDLEQGDQVSNMIIQSLPTPGTLFYNGIAVTSIGSGNWIPFFNINQFQYVITAAEAQANPSGSATFNFRLYDQGSNESAIATMTIMHSMASNDGPTAISISNNLLPETQNRQTRFATLVVTDPTPNDTHTFDILDIRMVDRQNNTIAIANDQFGIGTSSRGEYPLFHLRGTGTGNPGQDIDFETQSLYILTIRATDRTQLSTTEVITITVTDRNDLPTAVSPLNGSVDDSERVGTPIITLTATDGDLNDSHTFTLSNAEGFNNGTWTNISGLNLLQVNQAGVVSVNGTLNANTYSLIRLQVRVASGQAIGDFRRITWPDLITITINGVANNIPTSSDFTIDVAENGTHSFANTDFIFQDADAGDMLSMVMVQSAPRNGQFLLNSTVLTAGSSLTPADLGSLRYIPAANQSGQNYDNIVFTVLDLNSNESTGYTITINVLAGNVAPTNIQLDTLTLPENIQAAAVVGQFSVTDPDAGDTHQLSILEILRVTNTGNTVTTAISDFSIQGSNLLVNRGINFEEESAYHLRVQATDSGGDSIDRVITLTVVDRNDPITAVTATPITAIVDETATVGTDLISLAITDEDINDTYDYTILSIVGLNPAGVWQDVAALNLVTVDANGQVVTSGNLDFESFSQLRLDVEVSDQGRVLGDPDSSMQVQLTVTINDINDNSPTSADFTITVPEDDTFTFQTNRFVFNDPDVGDTLSGVEITALPGQGDLLLNGTPVTAGQTILPAQIAQLTYTPPPNEFGQNYTMIRFAVVDSSNSQSAEYTITIDVDPVNDAPTDLQLDTPTIAENVAAGTVVSDIVVTDDDPGDTHQFTILDIQRLTNAGASVAVPINGFSIQGNSLLVQRAINFETESEYILQIRATDGAGASVDRAVTLTVVDRNDPITAITVTPITTAVDETATVGTDLVSLAITDEDINDTYDYTILSIEGRDAAGMWQDVAALNLITIDANGQVVTSGLLDFESFQQLRLDIEVSDQGRVPGDPDSSMQVQLTVNINDINDSIPTSADFTITVPEDDTFTFQTNRFVFNDPDASDTLSGVEITALPGQGDLLLNGTPVTAGQTILPAQIAQLTYTPPPNEFGQNYTMIRFTVLDSGNNQSTEHTITIDVDPVNDAPTDLQLDTPTIAENVAAGTVVSDIVVTDDDPGDTHQFTILDIQRLTNAGASVAVPINGFSIQGNSLLVQRAINFETESEYILQIRATDGAGASVDRAVTLTVVDRNDPITAVTATPITTAVDETATVGTDLVSLAITDEDINDTYDYTILSIEGRDAAGMWQDVAALNLITIDANGQVVTSGLLDFESFQQLRLDIEVSDQGRVPGDPDSSMQVQLTVDINDINDTVPTSADFTITVAEDDTYTFQTTEFSFSDLDQGDRLGGVVITRLPQQGAMLLNGTAVTVGQVIAPIQLNQLTFVPSANEFGQNYTTINFAVLDSASNQSVDHEIEVEVTAVNDAPTDILLVPDEVSEDTALNVVIASLSAVDIDTNDAHTFQLLSVSLRSRAGVISTVPTADFAIVGNNLFLQRQLNFETDDIFVLRVRVTDSGLGDPANVGTLERELTLTVTDSNDPITDLTPLAATVAEDVAIGTEIITFTVTDEDLNDAYTYVIQQIMAVDANGISTLFNDQNIVSVVNGVLVTNDRLDFESYRELRFTLIVSDSGLGDPAAISTITREVVLTITPVNDELPTSSDLSFDVDERDTFTMGTNTIPFMDADAGDSFQGIVIVALPQQGQVTLGASGAIMVGQVLTPAQIATLRYRPGVGFGQNYAQLTYQLIDAAGNRSIVHQINWNVIDIPDPPTGVLASPQIIAENLPPGTVISNLQAEDLDVNDTHNFTIRSALVEDRASGARLTLTNIAFSINGSSLIANVPFDFETQNLVVLVIRAEDSAQFTFDQTLTFMIADANDPITAVDPATAIVSEVAPVGQLIVSLNVTDEDVNDTHQFIITNVTSGPNNIDVTNLNLITASGTDIMVGNRLDFETMPTLTVVGEMVDSGGFRFPFTLDVLVTDANDEIPQTADITATFAEDTTFTMGTITIPFMDQDRGDSLTGIEINALPGRGVFSLGGVPLTVGQVVNAADIPRLRYVPLRDENGPNYAEALFSAIDAGGNRSTFARIVWDVTPVNDPPTGIELSNNIVPENSTGDTLVGTLTAMDPDVGDTHVYTVVSAIVTGGNLATALPANLFRIVGDQLFTTAPLDFEVINRIELVISVSDGTAQIQQTFDIEVVNANDPITAVTPSNGSVSETAPIGDAILTLTITDQDQVDNYQVTILSIMATDQNGNQVNLGGSMPLTFDGQVLRVNERLDFEQYTSLNLELEIADSGQGDPAAISRFIHNLLIAILDENDEAPTSADIVRDTPEDMPYELRVSDFSFNDLDQNDQLSGLLIVTVPDNGSLELNGQTLGNNQIIQLADIPNVRFVPEMNANGSPYGTFVFRVLDRIQLASQDHIFTLNVIAENDAPEDLTLDNNTVPENQPGAVVGTFTVVDPDQGDTHSFDMIDVVGIDAAGNMVSLAITSFSIDNNAVLRIVAAADFEQINQYVIVVRVTDAGTGNMNQLSLEETFTIQVEDNNDPITAISPDSATVIETETVGHQLAAFAVSDEDINDSYDYQLLGVTAGNPNVANSFGFIGNTLTLQEQLDFEQTPLITLTLMVSDSGAGDPATVSSLQFEFTVTVLDANDEAPETDDATFTVIEDGTFSFNTANITFNDADAGDSLQSYRIEILPQRGQLLLNGQAIAPGQELTPAEFAALEFIPAANESGMNYANAEFRVIDQAGNESEVATITWDVTDINDPPQDIVPDTNTIVENIPAGTRVAVLDVIDNDPGDTFQLTILSVLANPRGGGAAIDLGSNAFSINGNELLVQTAVNFEQTISYAIRIRAVDAAGEQFETTLIFDTVDANDPITAVEPGDFTVNEAVAVNTDFATLTITDEDINDVYSVEILSATGFDLLGAMVPDDVMGWFRFDADRLVVASQLDFETAARVVVQIAVTDSGNSRFEREITITITDANDEEPTSTDIELRGLEDTPLLFPADAFPFMDRDANDQLDGVIITSLPVPGVLTLAGVSVTVNQRINAADIDQLVFQGAPNAFGDNYATFMFQVVDSNDNVSQDYQVTLHLDPVNDAPTAITVDRDEIPERVTGFHFADITVEDPDPNDAHVLSLITASAIDRMGNQQPLLLGDFSINGNQLIINTALDFEDTDLVILEIQATDTGANDPVGPQSITEIFTFTVINTNDPIMAVMPPQAMVAEDAGVGTDVSALDVTDPDQAGGHGFTIVMATGIAADGTRVDLTDIPFSFDSNVLQVAGELDFETFPNIELIIEVTDDGLGDPNNVSTFTHAMLINILDRNDENPETADLTVSMLEDSTLTFNTISFSFTDLDSGDMFSGIALAELPTAGTILLNGTTVTAGQVITLAELANLNYIPQMDEWGNNYASLAFQVVDSNGLLSEAATLTIDVLPENDPVTDITLDPGTVAENTPQGEVIGTLAAIDVDANDQHFFQILAVTRFARDGSSEVLDPGSFTVLGNQLLLQIPVNFEETVSYQLQVMASDNGGGNANMQTSVTQMLTVTVLDVNEPVVGASPGQHSVSEAEPVGTELISLQVVDEDLNDTYTVSIVSHQALDLDGNLITMSLPPLLGFNGLQLSLIDPLDHEMYTEHRFVLEINDDGSGVGNPVPSYLHDFTLTVLPANDEPPELNDREFRIPEDSTFSWQADTTTATDRDPGDQLAGIVISQLPANGSLLLGDVTVTVGQQIAQADLINLRYLPRMDEFGDDYDMLVFNGLDLAGNLSELVTYTWHVDPVNDAPLGVTGSPNQIEENAPLATSASTLMALDVDNNDQYSYEIIEIYALSDDGSILGPANGAFQVVGDQLLSNQVFDYENVKAYQVVLRVTDSGLGDVNQIKSGIGTLTVAVLDINEPPASLPQVTITINRNQDIGTLGIDWDQQLFADPEGDLLALDNLQGPDWLAISEQNLIGATSNLGLYTFTIEATDPDGETSTNTFVVKVVGDDNFFTPESSAAANDIEREQQEQSMRLRQLYFDAEKETDYVIPILRNFEALPGIGSTVPQRLTASALSTGTSGDEIFLAQLEDNLDKILDRKLGVAPAALGALAQDYFTSFDLLTERLRGLIHSYSDPANYMITSSNDVIDIGVLGRQPQSVSGFRYQPFSSTLANPEDIYILPTELNLLTDPKLLPQQLAENRDRLARANDETDPNDLQLEDLIYRLEQQGNANSETRSYLRRLLREISSETLSNSDQFSELLQQALAYFEQQPQARNLVIDDLQNQIAVLLRQLLEQQTANASPAEGSGESG